MIVVLQRVSEASVTVQDQEVGAIGAGLLVLVGAIRGDTERDLDYIAQRIATLRVFADEHGKMNRSLQQTGGQALLVSQFTLAGDTRKGRRPSFIRAMAPEPAQALIAQLVDRLAQRGITVATGVFGAHMQVRLVNDGPVTILLDSRETRRGHHREVEEPRG